MDELNLYDDLFARVRGDKKFHSIKSLIQPDDAEVRVIAAILSQADDFVKACQDFVDSFTNYQREVGDYWATPAELLTSRCPRCFSTDLTSLTIFDDEYCCPCGWEGIPIRAGDCDDKAILLVSLLRYELPPESVYCAVGIHRNRGKSEGHMWVVIEDAGEDHIVEATAPSSAPVVGEYDLMAIFNDVYAFSYQKGLREFNLIPLEEVKYVKAY